MKRLFPERMVRTTVYLSTDLLARVAVVAAARGMTSAAVIREGVASIVKKSAPAPTGGFLRGSSDE